jgi:hypothetical protein
LVAARERSGIETAIVQRPEPDEKGEVHIELERHDAIH